MPVLAAVGSHAHVIGRFVFLFIVVIVAAVVVILRVQRRRDR
jgi:hypothetical protein